MGGTEDAVPSWSLHSDAVVLPAPSGGLEVVPACVRGQGAHITEVLRGPCPPGAESLGGRLLAPAFVNAHTHLAMSAYRGIGDMAVLRGNVVEDLYFRIERELQPGDVRAFARVAALECLLAGTATVWDHYYAGRELADACREVGLCAVVAPTLQDLEGPGVPTLERQLAETVDIAQDAGLADAGVVAAMGPHATDTVSADLWGRVADLASAHHLPIHVHVAQTAEEYGRARERHGATPVGWLAREGWLSGAPSTLLVHGIFVDGADLFALDPKRDVLAHCPASQMQYCFPAWAAGWRKAGFRVVLGTDAGVCNDGMNVQQEIRLLTGGPLFGVAGGQAYRAFWRGDHDRAPDVSIERQQRLAENELTPSARLSTVWDVPGGLHPKLPVGRIAVGARANLIAFDTSHPAFWPGTDPLRALALQDVTRAIDRLMVNGRWLTAPGDHDSLARTPEARDAVREGRARLDGLLRRIRL